MEEISHFESCVEVRDNQEIEMAATVRRKGPTEIHRDRTKLAWFRGMSMGVLLSGIPRVASIASSLGVASLRNIKAKFVKLRHALIGKVKPSMKWSPSFSEPLSLDWLSEVRICMSRKVKRELV